MKRVGYLYDDMLDKPRIKRGIIKALKHKKKSKVVREILDNINQYTNYFYETLKFGNVTFSKGYTKEIHNGVKQRLIQVPTIRDHIIQHIMVDVLTPTFMKGMYKWNCGVVPHRGVHYARKRLETILRKHKPKYCLQLDISKYFHNVNTKVLQNQLSSKIKDKHFLELNKQLLDTANNNTNKGMPIGYYSSQWYANLYLEQLDHYIKQELKQGHYFRYVDDLIILGNNKRQLHKTLSKLRKYIGDKLNLSIKNNYQVFPIQKRCIDFCGYVFNYKVTRVRKRIMKKFWKCLNKVKQNINIYVARKFMSMCGWLKHTKQGVNLLHRKDVKTLVTLVKQYISKRDKQRLQYN